LAKKPLQVALCLAIWWPFTEDQVNQVKAISTRINLKDISTLVRGENSGDSNAKKQLDEILAETEVFIGAPLPRDIIKRSPKLKWIQSPLAGTDMLLTPEVIASPVVLTKARIHHTQISETVFNFMLMLARRSLESIAYQRQKKWERVIPNILHSKTIGILGAGNVGHVVARLAKAFGMRVIATRAHPDKGDNYVDEMLPISELKQILKKSDFLVILLPITKETKGLIGETELKLMKPTSFLINVGRGPVVDESALIRALTEKWIAGAGLDVFASEPQPLPQDSKLWELPNVIITPHTAGMRVDNNITFIQLIRKNLRRYLSGKELLNVVDKQRGY
jgi:phosphoglycerate dehydrogenase-like enzyme